MKRILSRMLALCLCLCLCVASASAANVAVLPESGDVYRMSVSMIPVGDTLYMMTVRGLQAQLHRWKKDMPEAETIATGLLYAERYNSMEEFKRDIPNLQSDVKHADAEHALSLIFTDGETLYGFNGLTNLVFAIDVTADGLRYTDVATLPRERVTSTNPAISVQRLGKWVLWQEKDSESRSRFSRVLAYNLESGTVKEAVLPRLADVTPYKDGLLLAICKIDSADASYAVYSYNPNTDEIALLGRLPKGINLNNAAYSAEMDLLVYQAKTCVMGWHPETGTEQLGFIPGGIAQEIAVMQDHVIYRLRDEISARSIERGYAPAHSLLVMNGNVNAIGKAFSEKNPEVPYYYEDSDTDDYEAFLTREMDAPDLLYMVSGDYKELIGKGLLMDLSAYPEIKAYVDVLYPPYKELAMEGDAIYGVPVRADAYNGWFINKEVMNAMGLKPEDIPTSLTELCAFANKWNNEFAEKYPHYTLLNNTTSYRERLLEAIIESWQDYCEFTGRPLTYDDPIFREAMAALDAASLDKLDAALKQTNPEISEYKQALIWTGCKTVGNWKTYMEDFSDRIFIPLTLTPETPYTCAVPNVSMWVVNAASQNAEYAAAMVTEAINMMDDVHAYVLRTDKTEPVLDDYAEKTLARERDKLAALEAKLEESVNKAAIEKRIEEQKTYIEDRVIPSMYAIVPSALENYVKVIEPATFISDAEETTSLERAAKYGCIERYLKGTYTVDEFINRMNELIAK